MKHNETIVNFPLSIFHCQLSIDKKTPWMGDWNSSGVNNHKINTYSK